MIARCNLSMTATAVHGNSSSASQESTGRTDDFCEAAAQNSTADGGAGCGRHCPQTVAAMRIGSSRRVAPRGCSPNDAPSMRYGSFPDIVGSSPPCSASCPLRLSSATSAHPEMDWPPRRGNQRSGAR
jgi:hypothetical protein